ncbi:MAG: hypothetical protein HXY18_13935 [Bryobacteraceae bacterium]|nr:hypothetical protein [Bryobacteraceae bacterium]
MGLRGRIMLLTVGLAAVLSLVLTLVQLNSLMTVSLRFTAERAASTAHFVKIYVSERAEERIRGLPEPASIREKIQLWRRAIAEDNELPNLLGSTLAQTRDIVEISVAGEKGLILASSTPMKRNTPLATRLPLKELLDLGPVNRFLAVLWVHVDYENTVALGVAGMKEPVFTIQVLVSSALLRQVILPELRRTMVASIPLLVLALVAAWLVAQLALWPISRISQALDRIASGEADAGELQHPAKEYSSSREFAAVQEKLRMLSEQFRGAKEFKGSVEVLLERLEEATFLFGPDGKLILCSEAGERLLRSTRPAMAGRSFDELFPPDRAVGQLLAGAITARQPLRDVVVGRLLLSVDQLPGGSTLVRMRDAEGRRIVESQLNLSTRLAAINRLTGGVAHEIKNPLNSIALRVELLRNRVLPEVPSAKDEIDVIAQEITRLDRVVRTFLDFTKPVELREKTFDLAETTRGLVELIRPELEQSNIRLEMSGLEERAPLLGDEGLLKQAVMNILRNAHEAMHGGGVLGVHLGRNGDEYRLTITDTGAGIPKELRERVFQLYYSTKEKGNGIGLAMAFRAVQLHNGFIEIGGEEGKGAAFTLRFPAQRAEATD